MGKIIKASEISSLYTEEIKKLISLRSSQKPKLLGFLATNDEWAEQYAQWTDRSCQEVDILYELKRVDKFDLEDQIIIANEDPLIHGIIVYYPVFGGSQDIYIQNILHPNKDVEGLSHLYRYNLFHNIRYLDQAKTMKSIIPCTPLAIIKALEYMNVYNLDYEEGNRLHGLTITIINRSEIVGRPLAAMTANDGAKVYSVDINTIEEYFRSSASPYGKHEVIDVTGKINLLQIFSLSDVVISGVPSKSYKIPTSSLKDGVIAINFSSFNNFEDSSIVNRSSFYLASVGKITIAMLQRNLVRLIENQKHVGLK